jgi:hypothetical protein
MMKTIKTRLGSLLLIGAACLLGHVPAFAGAAAHQIDMEIDDQPGYTPSPEEENLPHHGTTWHDRRAYGGSLSLSCSAQQSRHSLWHRRRP